MVTRPVCCLFSFSANQPLELLVSVAVFLSFAVFCFAAFAKRFQHLRYFIFSHFSKFFC